MIRKSITVALALIALAAVVAPALLGASDRDAYEDAIDSVLFEAELNNDRAEGAPQQQVVNGWTARDLLSLQSNQMNDLLELQSRITVLLLVLVLIAAWTAVSQHRADATTSTTNLRAHQPSSATTGGGSAVQA